jgi:hypothetical protein
VVRSCMCPTKVGNLLRVESGKFRFYVRWEANDIIGRKMSNKICIPENEESPYQS